MKKNSDNGSDDLGQFIGIAVFLAVFLLMLGYAWLNR